MFNLLKRSPITTIKEIAERAGVSVGTVDRILHNRGQVSRENIEKVKKIVEELGYKPNIFARNLALNRKFNFAVLLPKNKDIEYWEAPLRGIEKAENELSSFGVKVNYHFHNYDTPSFKSEAAKILKSKPDAVLFAPIITEVATEFIKECKKASVPFVMIDTNIAEQKPLSYVGQDAFQSGYLAGRLCNLSISGQGKILIIKIAREIEDNTVLRQRIEGFYSFFKNLKKEISFKELNFEEPELIRLDKEINKDTLSSIKAIYVPNSQVFLVAHYLEKNDLKTTVVGYDLTSENIEFLEKEFIDFLINQKPEEQGYTGINVLYRNLVLKQPVETHHYMPLEIVVKENYRFSKQ